MMFNARTLLLARKAVKYLFYDAFSTALAAGSVNGTSSEVPVGISAPPAVRTVVDTGSRISIAGGELVFSAGSGWNDPMLRYAGTTRVVGRAMYARVKVPSGLASWGFSNAAAGNVCYSPGVYYNTGLRTYDGAETILSTPYPVTVGNYYEFFTVLRGSQTALLLIRGGAYTQPTLLWPVANDGGTATIYPMVNNAIAAVDAIGMIDLAGIDSRYSTPFGLATSYVASPTNPTAATMTADGLVEFTWTAATNETLELDVRKSDADNRWIIRCAQAGSTIKIIERNAGVENERSSAAQTWTNATQYRIVVITSGNNIYTYVGATAKNSYTSASFNNTATGVNVAGFATGATLACWPRTVTLPVGV